VSSLWDRAIETVPLAFLDLEMTGVDPQRDRICEVAIHRVERGEVVAKLVTLVQPGVGVGASAEVHRIDDAMLSEAPTLASIGRDMERVLEGALVVGHAISFDLAFLSAAVARGELRSAPELAIDTRGLAQRTLRTGSVSLASLAQDLSLPTPLHRAEADVIATRALFERILEQLRPATPRHLLIAQQVDGPAALRDDIEAVIRDGVARGCAIRICYRVPGKDPFVDLLDPWAFEPPRVEGWLHRREILRALRGDRILWAQPTDEPFARTRPAGFAPTIPRASDP